MIVSTFIVQASFMIVTYDRQNMFIIQATGRIINFEGRPSQKEFGYEKEFVNKPLKIVFWALKT